MIYITFKGIEYEIPYDRETLKVNRTIDSTFDNGYFESVPLEDLGLLDVSRRIPRGLLARVEYDERTFYLKTGETHVQQLNYGATIKYKHRINLVSLSRDLTRKPMENITVTQPKGDFGQYIHSVNRNIENIVLSTGSIAGYQEVTPTLINTVMTNPSKIDELTIIDLQEYKITLDVIVQYVPSLFNHSIAVEISYGSTEVFEGSIFIPAQFSFKTKTISKSFTFNYTPTTSDDLSLLLSSVMEADSTYTFTSLVLSITGQEVISKPVRTYSQVIDKMLYRSEYVLSTGSRARLNYTAPEDKYEEYSLYDGLNKIGGYVGALVRVGDKVSEMTWRLRGTTTEDISGDSILDFSPYEYPVGTVLKIGNRYYENLTTSNQRREIIFEFFDNPSVFDPIGVIETMEQAELEDYVSAIELNTKNVVKPIRYSPFRDGWKSLRNLGGIGQFTTESIGYETEDLIERPTQVLIKGIPSRNAGGTITYDTDDVTDITERVLEKAQWDTLPSEADYSFTGKQQLLKNNTLYYIKGDNKIYGMSYIGETLGRLIGEPSVTRSIYEVVLAVRSIEEDERMYRVADTTKDDAGLDGDILIQMQVTYSNITQSRARLYKDDQTGFDTELIKYFNESANVNESEAIGNYAQQIVNRLGGTKISYTGVVDSFDDIAELGDIDSEGRVYTIIETTLGKRIKYKYTLVQDYNVISSYIGIQSRHRVEEISSDSNTIRTLRYVSKFIFTDTEETFTTRLIRSQDILDSLIGETSDGITYGYLECYLSNEDVKRIHLSIDSDSKGKTIELKWSLPTNYSAGLKRYSVVKGSDTIYLNSDVPYTDYYGKVNDILFSMYYDNDGALDADTYPEASGADGTTLFTVVTDVIDKDAREILHGLVEIPLLSESNKIRVYNGFARWNKLVEGTDRIRACALDYMPLKNAMKIDLSRVRDLTVSGTSSFGRLELSFTLGSTAQGIAFYNVDTLDILLVYADSLPSGANDLTLYYKVVDSRFGGGQNFTSFINLTPVTVDLEVSYYRSKDINVDVDYGTVDITITPEYYRSTDFIGEAETQDTDVSITFSYQITIPVYGVANQDTDITITYNYYRSNDFTGATNQDTDVSFTYQAIRFVSGGTSPSGGTTCTSTSDIGNTVCDSSSSCSFVSQSAYYSSTDDSVTPACTAGAERIQCMPDGGGYFCVISEGTITTTYTNCKICEVV